MCSMQGTFKLKFSRTKGEIPKLLDYIERLSCICIPEHIKKSVLRHLTGVGNWTKLKSGLPQQKSQRTLLMNWDVKFSSVPPPGQRRRTMSKNMARNTGLGFKPCDVKSPAVHCDSRFFSCSGKFFQKTLHFKYE